MPANGQYSPSDLVVIAPALGWPSGYGQPRLRRNHAAMISLMAPRGMSGTVNEVYRDLARQVYYRNLYLAGKGSPAAIPGTSKHGDGWAEDWDYPMNSWTSAMQAFWAANESACGYSSAQGRADGEPWHKVSVAEPSFTVTAGGGGTPIDNTTQRKDDDMPNPYWETNGTGWFGSVAVVNMAQWDVLMRYWRSTPDKADTFNGAQRDWIRNYLGLNNAYGIPAPVLPTFDTAKLASAVADALKAAKLTTVADPASLKQPLDDAFSRALAAWSKTIADQTKANIGFDPALLANAIAQQLQSTGIVVTPDTQVVQDAVTAAMNRATAAIGKSLQTTPN